MGLLKASDWKGKWIGFDHGILKPLLSGASWIWFPEGNPTVSAPVSTRYFRYSFQVPTNKPIAKGSIAISADNEFDLYVNGKYAGSGMDFTKVVTIPVSQLLKPGWNELAVEVRNIGEKPNPAGLIAKLVVSMDHGKTLTIITNSIWKSNQDQDAGWKSQSFNDSHWKTAISLGTYGVQPWGSIGANRRRLPARYLRDEFKVKKRVKRATAYVCGLGFFNFYLNGKKISDDVMDPALSDYTKACYYVTFDVTKQLSLGTNAIGIFLGNGRFFAPRLTVPTVYQTFGYPKLLLQLNIQYSDGTTDRVVSNGRWKLTTRGPIRANNEYDGEEYDARMAMPGWDRIGFNDHNWHFAEKVESPGGKLESQVIEPMKVTRILHPVSMTNPKRGVYVLDMGQNFYGTFRMKASAPRGTRVQISSAYSILPDGMLKNADNRSAESTDIYTFSGRGVEKWNPVFRGQGYRHIQITGLHGKPHLNDFEGLLVRTNVATVGSFKCSNHLINRIHQAVCRGIKMFLRSAPLDPDRDERQPWMGDPAKDAESEAYNFDVAAFYTKWIDDVRRSERADGTIPDVSMYWTGGDDVVWPSVFTIIPDWFIDFYGDRHLADRNYWAMKKWVFAMQKHKLLDGTLTPSTYGDWCDTSTMDGKVDNSGSTPRDLISTAYQYRNCRIMERLAKSRGSSSDEAIFAKLADRLKLAFNKKFLDPQTHTYLGKTQCGYVLALKFGLVPSDQEKQVTSNLVNDIIVKHNGHLTVGLIGIQWLMQVLTDVGRSDVAFTIATQTTRPSWGYMLSKGATTIWERWDYDTRDPGMNSEALLIQVGNLDAWFYQTLGGIRYAKPGFKKIIIRPEIVGDLTWAKANYDSVYGPIKSKWHLSSGVFDLSVTIPANTTATVYVPTDSFKSVTEGGRQLSLVPSLRSAKMVNGCAVINIGSGDYHFASNYSKKKRG